MTMMMAMLAGHLLEAFAMQIAVGCRMQSRMKGGVYCVQCHTMHRQVMFRKFVFQDLPRKAPAVSTRADQYRAARIAALPYSSKIVNASESKY
jgi:hypothetical protein